MYREAWFELRVRDVVIVTKPAVISQKVTISEPELVAKLRSHDASALDYLYDRYSAALNGVISRIISHEDIAEEVLQDAFLKIWNKIDTYDASKGRLFTWMLNVTRNLAIDRARSREISQNRKTNDIDLLVGKVNRAQQVETAVEGIGVRELLDRLPEEQKFVVEYLYLRGYTQSELAEESGIPLGTVKTRLRMAMMDLRKWLLPHT